MTYIIKFFLPLIIFTFSGLSFSSPTSIRVQSIQWSPHTTLAVEQWVSDAQRMSLKTNLSILLKEGDSGSFTEEEWKNWWKAEGKNNPPRQTWRQDMHGAQVVWDDADGVGCIVTIPSGTSYKHQFGELPIQWIIWHELSHCLWAMKPFEDRWLPIPHKSKIAQELRDLDEESWADGWSLAMSQKYLQISRDTVFNWMRMRTADAKKCKCINHWTNATLFQIYGMQKNEYLWESVEFTYHELAPEYNEAMLIKNTVISPKLRNTKQTQIFKHKSFSWFSENLANFQATNENNYLK